MNRDEILQMTDAYFSGRTSPEEEKFLFASLSLNEAGRDNFKNLFLLKTALQTTEETFPVELDERILQGIRKLQQPKPMNEFRSPKFIPLYVVTVFVMVLTIIFFNKMETYKADMDKSIIMIKNQQYTIELLMNGLPTVQVTPASSRELRTTNN